MYEVLRKILIEDLHIQDAQVRPEADRDGVGLDSLAVVELSMILSSRLGIEIGDDELLTVATMADIARLMEARRPHT